jgi:hypothetical protein
MAYDLLTKKIVPVNCSRDASLGPMLNKPTAALLIAGGMMVVKAALSEMRREGEKAHYQREFRRDLHETQEVPAIPMRELVRNTTEE